MSGAATREREHASEDVEVAIGVHDVGAVLLGACGDEHVGDRDPVLADRRELALGAPYPPAPNPTLCSSSAVRT